MSATFEARYPGRCPSCSERIEVGDRIAYDEDGNVRPMRARITQADNPTPGRREKAARRKDRPMTTTVKLDIHAFTNWLAVGERGISSETIVSHLTGIQVRGRWAYGSHPLDPADFRRCQLLLEAVPVARLMLGSMSALSPQWARLVEHWDEIDAAIKADVPDYLHGRSNRNATLGYQLMRRIIAGGVVCEDCTGSGRGTPCEKCRGTGERSGGRCRAKDCFRGAGFCAPCHGRGYVGGDR